LADRTYREIIGKLRPVGSFPRADFETVATLQAEGQYFAVRAEDERGQELATSRTDKPQEWVSGSPNHKRVHES
jgi:hypothetical protein